MGRVLLGLASFLVGTGADATVNYRSVQQSLMDQAVVRAEAAGKPVFVELSAAWCGPCVLFDRVVEASPELKAAISKFEFFKHDEVTFEIASADLFLPTPPLWYPSTYLYDPVSGRWSAIPHVGSVPPATLVTALETFARTQSLVSFWQNEYRKALQSGAVLDYATIINPLLVTAIESPTADALSFYDQMVKDAAANPAAFVKFPPAPYARYIFSILIYQGKAVLADLLARYPALTPALGESESWWSTWEMSAFLSNVRRTAGIEEVAKQCMPRVQKIEVQYQLDNPVRKISRRVTCLAYEFLAGTTSTEQIRDFVKAIPAGTLKGPRDIRLATGILTTSGRWTEAIASAQAERDAYAKSFATTIDQLKIQKTEAERQGDLARVKLIQDSIDIAYELTDRSAKAVDGKIEAYRTQRRHRDVP